MNNELYYNPNQKQLKISFLAPTGFGKSTACIILKDLFNSTNIKLATPLYDIQKYYYQVLGEANKKDVQDGELLQFLGRKIQRDYPEFLSNCFFEKLVAFSKDCTVKVITNDDCRPHNYAALRQMGFIFIGINGFSRKRNDLSMVDPDNSVEWQGTIPADYIIDNRLGIDEFKNNLISLMEELVDNKI